MFGSNILEVATGVIFVFILVSIICTAVREGIEGWLKTRAAYLEHGIRQLLADTGGTGLAKNIYNHPLIFGLFIDAYKPGKNTGAPSLFAKGGNLPSYIPSRNFAQALMDIAARGPMTDEVNSDANSPVISLEAMRINVANLGNPQVQRLLLSAIDTAQGDLNKVQARIEDWFNSGMDRVSGWYKRSTQIIIFAISLAMAIGLNINTLTIADYLTKNQTARELIVRRAEAFSKDSLSVTNGNYNSAKAELNNLGLPIGWPELKEPLSFGGIIGIFFGGILGWLFTALASSLGAPFWFDMLNKVMVIRSTVKPHEKSQEESSEDRQVPSVDKILQAVESPASIVQAIPVQAIPVPAVAEEGIKAVSNLVAAISPGQTPSVGDDDTAIDGCDVETVIKTIDEDLPITQGGVK
ncbi:hypothetical protein [Mucilaginibacter sp.]|uniref:hypothetical protein n=1 Tax=Mucilaginibacter sp. TaxID=1882438 RepID=UPI0026193DD4|nr:hypothetical protein [Mucilaginibacter sp.]MDB4923269.1 hypothetical protein [Mucilaginibacter sp.]